MVEGFETPKPERGESELCWREKERRTRVSEAAGESTLSHVQIVEFDGGWQGESLPIPSAL
jgi:hypothetical protein